MVKLIEKEYGDFHMHSVFSDGTKTPTEIVNEAIEKGIKCIALTDHNTISGISEFINAAKGNNINIIPGIEFSKKLIKLCELDGYAIGLLGAKEEVVQKAVVVT